MPEFQLNTWKMTADLNPACFSWPVFDNPDGTISAIVEIFCYKGCPDKNLYWKLTYDHRGPDKKLLRRTLYRGSERLLAFPLE